MAPIYQPLDSREKESDDDTSDFEENRGMLSVWQRKLQKSYMAAIAVLAISNVVFAGLWLNLLVSAWRVSHENHNVHEMPSTQIDCSSCARPQLVYSPATSILRYEKKRLWRDIDGPNSFTGEPRPELDTAWSRLIEPITIKVSEEELMGFSEGDESIAFKDGSGYLAELGVYHELHCIKRMRRYMHMEHYFPNLTGDDLIREQKHADHCLEYWRQSVMCRGDTTMGTFFWNDEGIPTSRVYTDNECVDWQALDTWARKRMVNTTDHSQFDRDTSVVQIS